MERTIYRRLQQHLDRQAVGFPAAWSGADIRLLKRLFSPDEARLALCLSYKPTPAEQIVERESGAFPAEQTRRLLESMFTKGAIGWKQQDGTDLWFVIPLVVGMYEQQDGAPSAAFLSEAREYFNSLSFQVAFLAVKPSQMRTIPVNQSIPVEHPIATYDQIRCVVEASPGPFVVLPCICRRSTAMRGKPCAKVSREETCLAFGAMARMVLRRKHCREVSREEVLEILKQNEEDGLVLQPENARQPEFVCSCCGCCCGMLAIQKALPHPVDFWASTYCAEVAPAACVQCGTCVSRCQVGAVTLAGRSGEAKINPSRCIGCGLCVSTCPSEAILLRKKESDPVPPANTEDLYDKVLANKKGALGQLKLVTKVALRMKQ